MHTKRWSQSQDMRVKLPSSEGETDGRSSCSCAFTTRAAPGWPRPSSTSSPVIATRAARQAPNPRTSPIPRSWPPCEEVGIELDAGPGTMLTQEMTDEAVRVIGMGCAVEEACPALRVPLEDWELDDPKGKSPRGRCRHP